MLRFWARSGVIVFAIVIMLLIGEVFLATALPNCLLSEEFDHESICSGAGISLVKWFLGSAIAMIFISVSYLVRIGNFQKFDHFSS